MHPDVVYAWALTELACGGTVPRRRITHFCSTGHWPRAAPPGGNADFTDFYLAGSTALDGDHGAPGWHYRAASAADDVLDWQP